MVKNLMIASDGQKTTKNLMIASDGQKSPKDIICQNIWDKQLCLNKRS